MKVLIIEDDPAIARIIAIGLQNERINTEHAGDATAALHLGATNSYDLIILDLLLPGKNGDELLRQLRNANCITPVIILTALSDLESKIKLFSLGADDYLVKPFQFPELLARMKSALRRHKIESGHTLVYDRLKMDMKKHQVELDGTKIDLREKEMKILEYMMRHPEQVLTREMILNYVWGPSVERYTNVVDVHIHHLREKIDKPYGTRLLKTVSSIGYKMSL